MQNFTLDFQNRAGLRKIYFKNFSSGVFFIPTQKRIPANTEIRLVLRETSGPSAVVLPVRIVQILEGATSNNSGLVMEILGFPAIQNKLVDLLNKPDDQPWEKVTDFSLHLNASNTRGKPTNSSIPDDLAPILEEADKILDTKRALELYDYLQVDHAATRLDIRNAYFRLSKMFHPDAHDEEEVLPQFLDRLEKAYQKVNRAYEVLSDPKRRQAYDLSLGIVVRQRGETKSAFSDKKKTFEKAKIRERIGDQVDQADRLYKQALESLKIGERKAAITNLKIALTLDPKHIPSKRKLRELGE